jgi:Fe-Mn family superoxide dismutase
MPHTTPHTAKDFSYLVGQIEGLSEKQLRAHFDLYAGYVKKVNEIEDRMQSADRSSANYSYGIISELHRRHAVAFNGAYLHQLYFENLTGQVTRPSEELLTAIERQFGSLADWEADMEAALISSPGWVLLCRSRFDGALRNVLVEEHHRGLLIEQDVLLALDGWEHAYMIDYGIKKAEYAKVLRSSVDWAVASRRFAPVRHWLRQEEAEADAAA